VVIAVTNQKGGVGKTTVTFNLGAALAAAGKHVVLVDADPAAGLSYAAGFPLADIPPEATTAALFRGQKPPLQALARGLQLVLASPPAMLDLEREWVRSQIRIERAWIADLAEIVLIDSPPNLGTLSAAAIKVSDAVIVPFIPEDASLGPFEFLLQTIAAVNPTARIIGAVPTLYDSRRKMSAEVIDAVRDRYGLNILTPVPRHVALASVPRYGKSVLEFGPKTAAAAAFISLAQEITNGVTA
jgi:chromosome partitioning protein